MARAHNDTELTEVFDILKNKRRMLLVELLADERGATDLSTVAETIADIEGGTGTYSQRRKRVRVALYQSHLPKLDDFGVVEYDKRSGSISRGDQFDRVHDVLQSAARGYAQASFGDRVRSLIA